MYLELNTDNSDKFCNWLIPYIQQYLINSIDSRKISRINSYLNTNKLILFDYNESRKISAENILIGGIYNLRIRAIKDSVIIEIDPNINIPNTSAKFIDIIKLINFGNMEINGYNIVTKTMNHFAENINAYYDKFLKEGN